MTPDKKYKVIIVDDDDFLVDMYVMKFGNSDIGVEACKSGEELLGKLKIMTGIDLILLDIVMPGMNGIEILKEMRKNKLGENIPIMMLTNQSEENYINEAKKLGIAGYIVKSAATPSEVLNEVLNIIRNPK
ncbi:MAG: response regulator [Patescibacteria group bacterium]|nr:response regulator [Patescibacteria group bacterium]